MKINSSKVGSGAEKIDRGEFALQETSTKRQICLCNDWETCFLPGQRVDMIMIFRRNVIDHNVCPLCATRRTVKALEENNSTDCSKCGMSYSHEVLKLTQVNPLTSRPSMIDLAGRDNGSREPWPRLYWTPSVDISHPWMGVSSIDQMIMYGVNMK